MDNLFQRQTFPHFLLIKASAGTGKTYELSKRITSFLLSDIAFNDLRNILAITFTVNASKEMRQRVMLWLKSLVLCDSKAFEQFGIPEDKRDHISKKADALLETILTSYKDFQIKTIDSFLTSIFKTCATDFGYPEDFQVALNNRECMKTAFDAYLNNIDSTSNPFFQMLDLINDTESTYNFKPHDRIFKNVRNLYVKGKHNIGGFINQKQDTKWEGLIKELKELSTDIRDCVKTHNVKINLNCSLLKMLDDLDKSDLNAFFTRGDKTAPVLKADNTKIWATTLSTLWDRLLQKRLEALYLYSERYYYPYISVLRSFTDKLETVKKSKEVIFIEDIPSLILENINAVNIPDVYIRLGGRLYHYYIDEFQDTSPIQYANLEPFIENSLSQGGSLFIVGDTKQAIYGFRDTDYEIMNRLSIKNPFPSVSEYCVKTLDKNYRSGQVILDYAKAVFDAVKDNDDYKQYTDSALFDWQVEVREGNEDKGYVSATVIQRQRDEENPKERDCIIDIVIDLVKRGYSYSDIAILAHKNSHIVEVSSWLSDREIPFISFSSLDIRNRKVIKELLWLLTFLDSPSDNLAFSSFLIGEVFSNLNTGLDQDRFIFKNNKEKFLYIKFKEQHPILWNTYFEGAFSNVGYLPVYELLCYLIGVFKINDNFPQESGAIAKLLEILKDLETEGRNSLKEFLGFIILQEEDEYESNSLFELPIPQSANAIRLMTVHKAKGLGFPVVIYLLYSLTKKRTESLKIHSTQEGLKALRINKNISKGNLTEIYDHLKKKEKINDLNSLYVGLTRAEGELYLIGVAYENERAEIKREFPVDLIIEGDLGNKLTRDSKIIELPQELQMTFNAHLMIHDRARGEVVFDERRRGESIHLILSRIGNISNLDGSAIKSKVSDAVEYCKLRFPEIDRSDYIKGVTEFVTNHRISPFFACANKEVYVEKEFIDARGDMIRIDRLIVDNDEVTILDFKTGQQKDAYAQQLRHYANVIREIYKDKRVSGYILYFDLKEVQVIM